ncbi:MAG TPA: hypothetical protein PLA50_02265, partial [Bacteroidia bacterium]|nr:hypothetical protein [Bacteroidia bacterium]
MQTLYDATAGKEKKVAVAGSGGRESGIEREARHRVNQDDRRLSITDICLRIPIFTVVAVLLVSFVDSLVNNYDWTARLTGRYFPNLVGQG